MVLPRRLIPAVGTIFSPSGSTARRAERTVRFGFPGDSSQRRAKAFIDRHSGGRRPGAPERGGRRYRQIAVGGRSGPVKGDFFGAAGKRCRNPAPARCRRHLNRYELSRSRCWSLKDLGAAATDLVCRSTAWWNSPSSEWAAARAASLVGPFASSLARRATTRAFFPSRTAASGQAASNIPSEVWYPARTGCFPANSTPDPFSPL